MRNPIKYFGSDGQSHANPHKRAIGHREYILYIYKNIRHSTLHLIHPAGSIPALCDDTPSDMYVRRSDRWHGQQWRKEVRLEGPLLKMEKKIRLKFSVA